jgi:AcrR family transcriptional regulator
MAAKRQAKKRKTGASGDRRRVLEAALAFADRQGWDEVSLAGLAADLGLGLDDLRALFRDKDAAADAWFRLAQDAMLAELPRGFARRPVPARLEFLLGRWFAALTPHRQATVEMLKAKLWPFHPHHYVPMVFHLSRLVQWLRDAAGLTAGGVRRQAEEIALTLLFLAVLGVWSRDDTAGQERTLQFLNNRLADADAWATQLWGRAKK